jgi:uncharacterized protein (DUF1778 family)
MTMQRSEQLRVRLSPEERALLKRRAVRDGRSLSGYVRHHAVVTAERAERIELVPDEYASEARA